ncbi:hypothetical protein [Methanobrevibacter sp.]|uniref:hypothetical protein n=1 Tax=Methanobrevibacter sp. TaxID=66852 RepID=UPI003867AC3A
MILLVFLCAVSQISAENPDNATLATDEIIQEGVSDDALQTSQADDALDTLQSSEDEVLNLDKKSFSEIRQKIANANDGDTIQLSGVYEGDGNHIVVDKSITIEGLPFLDDEGKMTNYSYVDAGKQSRIFYVSAPNVVIKNLVLRNGSADDGGAVYSKYEGYGTVVNCIIGLNVASSDGGALYQTDAYDSMFLNNTAGNDGGAIYEGSAYGCAFSNNTAGNDGGAICYKSSGSYTVYDCAFLYNTAESDGGAVYAYFDGVTVSYGDFRFNHADGRGGAIYSDYVDTEVRNCYFWENDADDSGGAMYYCNAYDCQIYLNSASNGGGMYDGEAYDCSFSWNTPQNTYGTDVYRSIKGQITLSQSGSYFGGKTVSAKVVDTNNNNAPLYDVPVTFKFSNGKSATVYTGSNGVATYNVPFNPGTYSVAATIPSSYSAAKASMGNVRIAKAPATIKPKKLTTKFGTCKKFKVSVINSKTKKGIGGVKLLLKVYTGKKAKKVHVTTDGSGNAYYAPSKLKVGKHKVKVSIDSKAVSAKAKKSRITVKKASVGLDTYDGIWYYKDVKKGKYYIGVYNKNAGGYLKGIKLKVKVYTGKKAKTYTLKTKKDGFAILKTKGIKVGKHKVKITFKGNKNFKKASAKNTIEVTKRMPTRVGYHYMFTSYFYGIAGSRSVMAYVKDMHGNELNHKKITIYGSLGGKTTGYSGEMIRLPSGSTVVMKFAGNKKYMPSTFTIHFI